MLLFSFVLPVFLFLIMFLAKTKTASWRRCNWNDLLDSFVLFIFQGVQVNPSRYNLTYYTVYLFTVYLYLPYSQALHPTGLPSLQERRENACIRFISKISPDNPLYALILSRSQPRESPYNLRRNTNIVTKQTNTDRFAQFVTCKYATYLDS